MRTNYVHCGEALAFLERLPDAWVGLCLTSPPYWGLRGQACRSRRRPYGVRGQLGLERTIEGYVRRLVRILDEVRRVLKPTGSLYLNLGDTYVGSWGSASQQNHAAHRHRRLNTWPRPGYAHFVARPPSSFRQQVREKSLAGVPWRLALRLIGQGWILRNAIIWHKPNALPSSVGVRATLGERTRLSTEAEQGRTDVRNEFTAIIERDGEWFVAYCPEIPEANGQGRTPEEATESLADGIALILDYRREKALQDAPAETVGSVVVVSG